MNADPLLIQCLFVALGFVIVQALVIWWQGRSLAEAHRRLREYADKIRALTEKLSKPRAPKGWTHG